MHIGRNIQDSMPIKDHEAFLANKDTKASLVLYLANHLIRNCKASIVTVTGGGVV